MKCSKKKRKIKKAKKIQVQENPLVTKTCLNKS